MGLRESVKQSFWPNLIGLIHNKLRCPNEEKKNIVNNFRRKCITLQLMMSMINGQWINPLHCLYTEINTMVNRKGVRKRKKNISVSAYH